MIFTEEHQWLREEDGEMVVGITAYAIEQLGNVVFLELPEEGITISKDDEVAVIEGDEEATDFLAPLDGEITEVNTALNDNPGMLNDDPQGEAWLFKVSPSDTVDLADFMDEGGYQKYIR